jgi:hypothetical protein
MEIRGDQTAAVIDVDHVSGEKEVIYQRDYTPICGAHRLTDGSTEIDTEVATGQPSIENSARSEFTRDCRRSWTKERRGPHQRRIVRALPDLAGPRVFAVDSCRSGRVEWAREAAVDSERLSHWRRKLGQSHARANRLDLPRRVTYFGIGQQAASGIDGNRADRVPRSGR